MAADARPPHCSGGCWHAVDSFRVVLGTSGRIVLMVISSNITIALSYTHSMRVFHAVLAVLLAFAPAVSLTMYRTNAKPFQSITKRQFSVVAHPLVKAGSIRMPPVDLSDLPTDPWVLVEMVETYTSLAKKASRRVEDATNGRAPGLKTLAEYHKMIEKWTKEIERIKARIELLSTPGPSHWLHQSSLSKHMQDHWTKEALESGIGTDGNVL
ncbi:hypothetical protein V8E36_007263 [Tilletia maclaganii]